MSSKQDSNTKKDKDVSKSKGSANVEIQQIDTKVMISMKFGENRVIEKSFLSNTKISAVIEEFKHDALNELSKENSLEWFANGIPLNLEDEIGTIFKKDLNKKDNIEISVEVLGLANFVPNPTKVIRKEIELIGKPVYDPFEIYVFSRETKHFHQDRYDTSIIQSSGLNYFSNLSGYCNGNNRLYISGGEKDDIVLRHFWIIDLKTKDIEKDDHGIMAKKQHSMIYIPNNYVFIVGGNDKNTFYYDIEHKTFPNWAELNEERIEPALAIINNKYLYAFSNIKSKERFNATFEKTNLREHPKWELVIPLMNPPELEFDQKFFAVCELTNDQVIFLGGNMNEKANLRMSYEYDTNNNTIKESDTPFQQFDFAEKTFMPFNDSYSFLIPRLNQNESKLIIFNKKENRLQPIHFSQMAHGMKGSVTNSMISQKKALNLDMPKKPTMK